LEAAALDEVKRNAPKRRAPSLDSRCPNVRRTRVFDRDEGVLHVIWNLLDRTNTRCSRANSATSAPSPGVNAAGDWRLVVLQIFQAWQPLQRRDQEDDHRKHAGRDSNAEANQNLAPRNAATTAAATRIAIVATIILIVVVLFVVPPRGRMNLFATLRPASARLVNEAARPRLAMRRD
jgi:hypothetical protein